jgi:hypothetical protein
LHPDYLIGNFSGKLSERQQERLEALRSLYMGLQPADLVLAERTVASLSRTLRTVETELAKAGMESVPVPEPDARWALEERVRWLEQQVRFLADDNARIRERLADLLVDEEFIRARDFLKHHPHLIPEEKGRVQALIEELEEEIQALQRRYEALFSASDNATLH